MSTNNKLSWYVLSKYRNMIYGLATISIVLLHYCNRVPLGRNLKSVLAISFRQVIGSIGVEFFVLMSGICLYFSFVKNQNVKEFYSRRLNRMLVPYLLAGVPFYIYKDFIHGDETFAHFLGDISFINMFLEGDVELWYIGFSIIAYIAYPYIFKFYEKFEKNGLIMCLGLFGGIGVLNYYIYTFHIELYNDVEIFTLRYLIFVLGCYLGKKVYNKESFKVKHYLFIAFVIVVKLAIDYLKYFGVIQLPRFCTRFVALNTSLFFLILAVALMYVLKFNPKSKFLNLCGAYSLEIYLVHMVVLKVLDRNRYPVYRYRYFALYLIITAIGSWAVAKITPIILKKFSVTGFTTYLVITAVGVKIAEIIAPYWLAKLSIVSLAMYIIVATVGAYIVAKLMPKVLKKFNVSSFKELGIKMVKIIFYNKNKTLI